LAQAATGVTAGAGQSARIIDRLPAIWTGIHRARRLTGAPDFVCSTAPVSTAREECV
jgi:hypothetical protein